MTENLWVFDQNSLISLIEETELDKNSFSVPSLDWGSRLLMTTHWTVDSSLPPTPPDTPDDGINHFNSRKWKTWREHQWCEAPLPRGLSLSWTPCRCLRLQRRSQLSPVESPSVARRPWCRPHSPEPSLWSYRCLKRKSRYFERKVFSPCKAGTTRRLYLVSFLLNKKDLQETTLPFCFFFPCVSRSSSQTRNSGKHQITSRRHGSRFKKS